VISRVVKCRQLASGPSWRFWGRGLPLRPCELPPPTETGLDYSYSTAARAFEGEAQARPTPRANPSNPSDRLRR